MSTIKSAVVEPVFTDEKGAAVILGWAVQTLQRKRSRGEGPPYYRQPRLIRYNIRELCDWMQKFRVEPTPRAVNLDEKRGRPRKYPLVINGIVVKPAAAKALPL